MFFTTNIFVHTPIYICSQSKRNLLRLVQNIRFHIQPFLRSTVNHMLLIYWIEEEEGKIVLQNFVFNSFNIKENNFALYYL